jgi:hypothetical protein
MAQPDLVNAIFYDASTGQVFTNVGTNYEPSTTFATEVQGSSNTIFGPGAIGTLHVYAAEITTQNLYNATTAIDNIIKAANGGTCPSHFPRQAVCYSTNAADYQLVGLENGNEMAGASEYLGSWDSIAAAISGNSANDNPALVVKRLKRDLDTQVGPRPTGRSPFETYVRGYNAKLGAVTRPPSRALKRLMQ